MYNQYSYPYQSFQKYEVVRVNGKNGAEAFQMSPNSSVLLLDETAPIVWLKTTDGAGYPTLTPYSIAPYQPEPEIDTKSLLQRIERLEGMINEQSNNAKVRKSAKSSNGANETDA